MVQEKSGIYNFSEIFVIFGDPVAEPACYYTVTGAEVYYVCDRGFAEL